MPSEEINNYNDPTIMPPTLSLLSSKPTSHKGTIKFSLASIWFKPGLLGGSSWCQQCAQNSWFESENTTQFTCSSASS